MLTTNKLLNPARGSGRSGADVTAEFCRKLKIMSDGPNVAKLPKTV